MNVMQRNLLAWYAVRGRADLPWRVTRNPYFTVVSEFMLQQTQVERVAPKFTEFVERFGSFEQLAASGVADVLRAWQGLGYNSRALRLKKLAEAVMRDHAGIMPSDTQTLRRLAGVGAYSAAAIRVFAFDIEDAALDTNVRRILHRYAHGSEYPPKVNAVELDSLARDLVPHGFAHDWHSALMDLGASICTARKPRCGECPLTDACVAAPLDSERLDRARRASAKPNHQAKLPFKKTTRFTRGRIVDQLRALPPGKSISLLDLYAGLAPLMPERSLEDVRASLDALARDGLVVHDGAQVALHE